MHRETRQRERQRRESCLFLHFVLHVPYDFSISGGCIAMAIDIAIPISLRLAVVIYQAQGHMGPLVNHIQVSNQ